MRLARLVIAASLLLTGCPADPAGLVVDLRTDLVPGEEFVAVEAVLDETGMRVERPASSDRDYYAGQRVADFMELAPGDHTLLVRLLDGAGEEVASRRVRVQLDTQLAVVVLISRGCAAASCADGTTCVRDVCSSVACHEELNPGACEAPECEADADCAPIGASCAVSRCELGTCLAEPVAGMCGGNEFCDVASGCRPRGLMCDPLPGLLGYWPMDAADVSGNALADRSGNDRGGMINGTPTTTPSLLGDALDFSMTAIAYIDLPGLPVDSSPGAFNTVSMWFFRDGPAADEVLMYWPSTPSAMAPRYDLWLTMTPAMTPALCINTGSSECWGFEDPGLLDRWVHVTAVFANGRTDGGQLYVDGLPVSMTCVFGGCDLSRTVQAPVTLGAGDSTYAFHGKLDEVRIYDRALTAAEAAARYACEQ